MPLQISLVFSAEIDGKIVRKKVPAVSTFESDEILSGESVSGNILFDLSEYPTGIYNVYFAAGTAGVYPATLEKPRKVIFE